MKAGVDEAGRGPMLGPLVMCAFMADESSLPSGVCDSKVLSKKQREALYDVLISFPHEVVVVKPSEIDAAVFENNLNWLEADHTATLLNALKPSEAVLDCPSRNIESYKDYVRRRTPGISIHAQFKADVDHPVVSAASIIAKVTRDRIIEELHNEVGVDFGSGYPSDPKTKAFLRDSFDASASYWRKSWAPVKNRLVDVEQQTL